MITIGNELDQAIDLRSHKLIVYDLEIKKAIPPKDGVLLPGIKYCNGWQDFSNMGISCVSWCEVGSTDAQVSLVEDPHDLRALFGGWRDSGYLIGGFHSLGFDDHLLTANGLPFKSDFDLLVEIIKAAGLTGVKYWQFDPKPSYTLDHITSRNGLKKTGRGDLAPIWYQEGKIDQLLSYGKDDASIEAQSCDKFLKGTLVDPNTDKLLVYRP